MTGAILGRLPSLPANILFGNVKSVLWFIALSRSIGCGWALFAVTYVELSELYNFSETFDCNDLCSDDLCSDELLSNDSVPIPLPIVFHTLRPCGQLF